MKILPSKASVTRTVILHNPRNWAQRKSKGGGVAFLIIDTILYQEFKLKTSDKHLEVHARELIGGGYNIKLLNDYIPPSSSCDAGYKRSISNLLEFDVCIFFGSFNAHSPLWHSNYLKTQEKTILQVK